MSTRVAVIGAGYAGAMAANRLAASRRGSAVEVLLLSERDVLVERIRLHEYAAGSAATATVPLGTLLHPSARRRTASVLAIDDAAREIVLQGGERLPYDAVILATGSGTRAPEGAHSVADLPGAARLRAALEGLPEGAVVVVVGGGPTAVETATEIAERRPSLTVRLRTSGEIAPGVSSASRERIRRRFARGGIELVEGAPVTAGGDVRGALGAEVVVWCAGFDTPSLAADSGLPVTADGRLRVDPTLAAVGGGGRVFGAGDAAILDDARYGYHRRGCASALPMGAHAADNVLRILAGEALEPISAGFAAHCLSLGRRDGLVQLVAPDDRPRALALPGRLGALAKEAVCRQTLRWLRGEARRGGSYSWPRGPELPAPATTKEVPWS